MRDTYENYFIHRPRAIKESEKLRKEFDWNKIAENASDRLSKPKIEKEEKRGRRLGICYSW
jgi:hypothetical protein